MLMKILDVKHNLKFISYNILANIALDRIFIDEIQKNLITLRLQFEFSPNNSKIIQFLFNYFYSKNFKIESKMQEQLIETLYSKTEPQSKDDLELVAQIWIGLLNRDDNIGHMPPNYLLDNYELEECDTIREIVSNR